MSSTGRFARAALLAGLMAAPPALAPPPEEPPPAAPDGASTASRDGEAAPEPARPGEACLVCAHPVSGDGVALRHRGRRVVVHGDAGHACLDEWERNTTRHFASLQPRGALFQEAEAVLDPPRAGWLLLGVWIVIGLVTGAVCGYLAVSRGLAPLPWFFAGLAINVVALALLMLRPRGDTSSLPAGIPGGLAKVPVTRSPATCSSCGASNHPSAASCGGCGSRLDPSVRSETEIARASGRDR